MSVSALPSTVGTLRFLINHGEAEQRGVFLILLLLYSHVYVRGFRVSVPAPPPMNVFVFFRTWPLGDAWR